MAGSSDNQYLTFGLDGEIYAVPVGKVREVLEYVKPTRLPETAAYFKGIINVRGSGIPVVDLRARFGLSEAAVTQNSAVIVMEIGNTDGRSQVIGALTDEVHEVVDIAETSLEIAPTLGGCLDAGYIRAVGKRGDSFVIVLDIDKVFREGEEPPISIGSAS